MMMDPTLPRLLTLEQVIAKHNEDWLWHNTNVGSVDAVDIALRNMVRYTFDSRFICCSNEDKFQRLFSSGVNMYVDQYRRMAANFALVEISEAFASGAMQEVHTGGHKVTSSFTKSGTNNSNDNETGSITDDNTSTRTNDLTDNLTEDSTRTDNLTQNISESSTRTDNLKQSTKNTSVQTDNTVSEVSHSGTVTDKTSSTEDSTNNTSTEGSSSNSGDAQTWHSVTPQSNVSQGRIDALDYLTDYSKQASNGESSSNQSSDVISNIQRTDNNTQTFDNVDSTKNTGDTTTDLTGDVTNSGTVANESSTETLNTGNVTNKKTSENKSTGTIKDKVDNSRNISNEKISSGSSSEDGSSTEEYTEDIKISRDSSPIFRNIADIESYLQNMKPMQWMMRRLDEYFLALYDEDDLVW